MNAPFPALDRPHAAELLERMAGLRAVVVGDLFLDEYLVGRAERLSREGPVPVLRFRRRFCVPGGAANPARNIAALGAAVVQVGVIGPDDAGDELRAALRDAGIQAKHVVTDEGRPTTRKTRVVAEGLSAPQQVARIDRQERGQVDGRVEEALVLAVEHAVEHGGDGADLVLVSHYRSGAITPAVVDAARRAARSAGAVLTVDAQGDLEWFAGFDLVRVGRGDAARGLERNLRVDEDYATAGANLRERLGCAAVMLGRGAEGTSVVDATGHAVLPPANVTEVFDVSGAGDTVIAVVSLALAAGAPLREAVTLANRAAGLVVRRLGAAAPDRQALQDASPAPDGADGG